MARMRKIRPAFTVVTQRLHAGYPVYAQRIHGGGCVRYTVVAPTKTPRLGIGYRGEGSQRATLRGLFRLLPDKLNAGNVELGTRRNS